MKALAGYTGFVGSNLYAAGQFDAVYNSKNIRQAYGTNPDLLVYAALPAEKYLANRAAAKDMERIVQAEKNLAGINPKQLVLISTIDVFQVPRNVDETSAVDVQGLCAYGYNRYQLELWVREHYPDALIIRLPGLFGKNIKKNFIYDFINVVPSMLKQEKMEELAVMDAEIKDCYVLLENGFYQLDSINEDRKEWLKDRFRRTGFTALHFTDSRSIFQFYNLKRLWNDMQTALNAGIRLWHPAAEPVSAAEIYRYLTGETFVNILEGEPPAYDYKTVYDALFGGCHGYVCDKNIVLKELKEFVETEKG